MKRARLSTLLLLSLCACSDRASIAVPYKNPWDRAVVQLGFGFGYVPCYRREETPYGDVFAFIGDEACFRFDPPMRMRGVWLRNGRGRATPSGWDSPDVNPSSGEGPASGARSPSSSWVAGRPSRDDTATWD